jgi:hypothetical protein
MTESVDVVVNVDADGMRIGLATHPSALHEAPNVVSVSVHDHVYDHVAVLPQTVSLFLDAAYVRSSLTGRGRWPRSTLT